MFFLISCSSEEEAKAQLKIPDITITLDTTVNEERPHVGLLFTNYSDSMRNYKKGEQIPYFIFNHLLDYEHPWLTDHRTLSLRKLLFDSTTNIDLLNTIVNSQDVRLKKIVLQEEVADKQILSAIPFRETANYYLAKNRLSEIIR